MSRFRKACGFTVIVFFCCQFSGDSRVALADEKPSTMPPAIKMTIPAAIDPATTKSLMIRGLQLDQISGIQCDENPQSVSLGIVRKEKSAPPEKVEVNDVGDTLAEVSLNIPADFTGDSLAIHVISEHGTSERFRIPVMSGGNLIAESEPNDSLRRAQPFRIGTTIQALIAQPKDVDVYEIHGTAGEILVADVTADRIGSPCDSQLTLFDSSGQILKIADDSPGSCDAILRATLPRDDTYRIVVLEATDRGSAICTYLLRISIQAK